MPSSVANLGSTFVGPGAFQYPVQSWPGGAVIFVNSATGTDSRGRLKFQGTPASIATQPFSALGPFGDPNKPLASVFGPNGALSFVKAGRGDIIVVAPGHSENIPASTISVPGGVAIVGVGTGSQRPTFAYTNTSCLLSSNGAAVQFNNCIFDMTQVASLTLGIQIQHSGWQFQFCRIIQSTSTNQATTAIKLLAGADDFLFANSELDASAAAGATNGIQNPVTNNINRPYIVNSYIHGNFSGNAILLSSTSTKEFVIEFNTLRNDNAVAVAVTLATGNTITGFLAYNDIMLGGTGATTFLSGGTGTGICLIQNFMWDTKAAASGILAPPAGTP